MVLKTLIFVKQLNILYISNYMIWFKFRQHIIQIHIISSLQTNNVWRDFRLQVSAFAVVARKNFNGKFTAKLISDRGFYVTLTDADIGRQKSLHTLFDKYLNP